MAIPDGFRFMFVALAAMTAYRFASELGIMGAAQVETPDLKTATPSPPPPGREPPKLRKDQVLIQHCTSWGYKGTANQVAQLIQQRALENLEVRDVNYDPPPEKVTIARVVSYVQMTAFAVVFFGKQMFEGMKMETPDIVRSMQDNKLATFMMLFFLGNTIQQSLLATKAFEIYHGDQHIWSSLETGRLPNMQDLVTAFGKTGVEFIESQTDRPGKRAR